ncbi:MAG: outer membrane protein assembly factor BamD [Pseudomonadota bacterium]|jgi:outer membrane protein assembly factor BamD
MTSARHKSQRPVSAFALGAAILASALLAGCSSQKDNAALLNPDPPAKMYAAADNALQRGSFAEAARRFEELDRDHPYAPETRRALVMASYAYYKAAKFPEAIAAAQRYTTLHPGTKEAALAHHIIASAHFDEIKSPGRDQTATRKALSELRILRQRYPDSPYSKQADNRIRIAEDILAAHEMSVGRYYLKQAQYQAAINRYKTVITEFQTTVHVEEALYRLVEAYMAFGIMTEAQAAAAVLGHNFPNSQWYADSYALLGKSGLQPQAQAGGWLNNAIRTFQGGTSSQAPPVTPQPVPQGLPRPEELPQPRSNVPVSGTVPVGKQALGLNQ